MERQTGESSKSACAKPTGSRLYKAWARLFHPFHPFHPFLVRRRRRREVNNQPLSEGLGERDLLCCTLLAAADALTHSCNADGADAGLLQAAAGFVHRSVQVPGLTVCYVLHTGPDVFVLRRLEVGGQARPGQRYAVDGPMAGRIAQAPSLRTLQEDGFYCRQTI